MKVKSICQRDVDLADKNESATVAAQRMGARNVGTLIVVDMDERPIGILTDRDLALKVTGGGLDPDRTSVGEIMTSGITAVTEDTSIESALALMGKHGVRRLPTVGGNGALVGIVSFDDVLLHIADDFQLVHDLLERRHRPRTLLSR